MATALQTLTIDAAQLTRESTDRPIARVLFEARAIPGAPVTVTRARACETRSARTPDAPWHTVDVWVRGTFAGTLDAPDATSARILARLLAAQPAQYTITHD